MSKMQDQDYMRRCLELAQRGAGRVAPNPMVGAVLVHEGRIIGEGWHRQYGQAHAEVNCLAQVAEADRPLIAQSTMYVSLEPCAHTGKTPPCALRLIQESIPKVVMANRDPFAQVNGAGRQLLEQAGIPVEAGLLEQEGRWLNRRFFCFHEQQRPYIILKWAQSAEGYLAPADRSRRALSNAFSHTMVHRWRTEEAAILVGFRTALHDDPQLTARRWDGPQPLRLVLDRDLQLPRALQLFSNEAPTWVLNGLQERVERNVHFVQLDFSRNILPQLMERLYRQGKLSLIVEGGAALLQSFLDAGLWDEARLFKTPGELGQGLAAPLPLGGQLAWQTDVAGDALELWVNSKSAYPYCTGMSL